MSVEGAWKKNSFIDIIQNDPFPLGGQRKKKKRIVPQESITGEVYERADFLFFSFQLLPEVKTVN